eukprot:TRINITY_DN3643_c0_g1_i10.p1 TRINITY_DN3643_c0_g1~~TRINITY_DN3643_c0_g1_i10.p1  ORF type:complete len:708 (+),score=156.63 TRINITY_DN3643_c0_g1_i10:689-2812(+)
MKLPSHYLLQGYSLAGSWAFILRWQEALHNVVTALILAIIIIVVAVPEGLPMMIAIVLALNMQKLLDRKVLVRKLLGIETAGSLNILFTDKTGTITRGHLEAHEFVSSTGMLYKTVDGIPSKLRQILSFAVKHSTASHITSEGQIVGGNSSDRAFLAFLNKDYVMEEENVFCEAEVLFSSILKFAARSVKFNDLKNMYPDRLFDNSRVTLFKGAPEKIISRCCRCFTESGDVKNFSREAIENLVSKVNEMSGTGIRLIAVAASHSPLPTEVNAFVLSPKLRRMEDEEKANRSIERDLIKADEVLGNDLILIGLIALRDEVREESKGAIQITQQAGIQVVMITGDKRETAIAIAREVGLLPPVQTLSESISTSDLPYGTVIESSEIKNMSTEELAKILPNLRVISRALPTDKSKLIKVSQDLGLVVGMTGDGVNDAAALYKADVGFAMGKSGTDMAKEASDIVIMDDNFDSITVSILYGRTIFRSIRKFIIFQSTINVASTLLVFLGPFLGFDFPLTLIQLLWVNLVMDTLAALAFGGEPALLPYMREKPINRNEAIITPYMWSSILVGGISIASFSFLFLLHPYFPRQFLRDGTPNEDVFLTAFFAFYIFITSINALNVRTQSLNIFDNITQNRKFLLVLVTIFVVQIVFTMIGGKVLRTVPLTTNEWIFVGGLSLLILPWDMMRKMFIVPLLSRGSSQKDLEHKRK